MTTKAKFAHTPEPWVVDDEIFVDGPDGKSIFGGASTQRSDEECAANADRIAACVNALKGIPTEAIEGGVIKDLLDAAEAAYDDYGERGVAHIWMPLGEALRKAGRI